MKGVFMKNTIKKVEVSYVGEKNRLPIGTFIPTNDEKYNGVAK
jgi:hypothetical protein